MTLAPWSSPNHPKSATQQNHQMSFNLLPTNWIRSPTTPVPKRDRRKVLFRQGITPVMARGCNGENSAGTWYCLIVFGMASAVIPAVIFTTSNLQGTHLPLPQPPPAPGGSATKSETSLEFPIMEASWVSRVDRGATGRQLQNEVRRSIYISAILWSHVVVTISTILSTFFLNRSRLPTSSPVTLNRCNRLRVYQYEFGSGLARPIAHFCVTSSPKAQGAYWAQTVQVYVQTLLERKCMIVI